MEIKSINKKKKLIILIIVAILIVAFLITNVFAAFPVTTRNTTHWFYKLYNGSWGTLKTPRFYNKYTYAEYYCLQPRQDYPASTYYSSSNVIGSYSTRVKTGLQIILQNGYPYNYMGLNQEQARYITANAIRAWLSETGQPYQYNFMNLGGYSDSQLRYYADRGEIPNKIRANGYNTMLRKMVDLLILARNQDSYRDISMGTPTMTISGNYFVGTATVNLTRLNQGYTVNTSSLPSGSTISGYTGKSGDTLTIKIPATSANANNSYSLSVTGSDYRNMVSLFAYSPSSSSQQNYQIMMGSNSAWYTVSESTSVSVITPSLPNADLIVSSVTTNRTSYNYGDRISVTVKVENQGGQNTSGFYVSLASVFGTNTKYISSLNTGTTEIVTFYYTAPHYTSNETIMFTAKADHYNSIAESNESNNTGNRFIIVFRSLPDITISSLTTEKNTYDNGETITVTATIKNNGNYSAGSFYVRLSSDLGTNNRYISSLDVGSTTTVTYTYTAPVYSSNHSITFTVNADYNSRITESNENNNTSTKNITINKALSDLTITSLTPNKTEYNAGDTILITATVKNIGNYTASSSYIRLTVDNLGSFVSYVGSVSPNGERDITFISTAPTSQAYLTLYMTATADYYNDISESNESNNTMNGTVYVDSVKPDLTIIDSTVQNWYENKMVCVSATISNLTAQSVPNVTIAFTIDNQTYTENICVEANSSNLVVFSFMTPVSGDYTVKIDVDPNNTIHESDESNNILSEDIEVLDLPLAYVIDPDDISMEERYDIYGLMNLPNTINSNYHEWQEVRYSNGSYVTHDFYARLDTTLSISPDERLPDNGDTMESGYGISCLVTTTLTTNYDNPEKLVGVQNVFIYYPESTYGQSVAYENIRSSLDTKTGNEGGTNIVWQYKVNPYSTTNSKLHYTPLFFPDGRYTVLSQAFYSWSPLGQMYEYTTDYVNIEGDMYDHLTNVRR